MKHVIVGTVFATRVKQVWMNGKIVLPGVVEANEEDGWVIRHASTEEIDRLVTEPGLIWPRNHDVLIQEWGRVRIEMVEE